LLLEKITDIRSSDQIIYRNESEYLKVNERWSGNIMSLPTWIFLLESASDVSAAIKTFVKAKGNQGACRFAIKSGGHTPWAGGNNVDGVIALDLSNINETAVAGDRSVVRL